jgi:hypothetical protein
MTLSELLCHLMMYRYRRTSKWLNRMYGARWQNSMRHLVDLELVMYARSPNTGKWQFYVTKKNPTD